MIKGRRKSPPRGPKGGITFGPSKFKAARIDCGFTQEKLAELAGFSLTTIKVAERGQLVAWLTAEELAKVLGKPLAELLNTVDIPALPQTTTTLPDSPIIAARPSVKIVHQEIISPLTFTPSDWGRIAIRFNLKNIGGRPASFVTTNSRVIPLVDAPSPRDILDIICTEQPSPGQGFNLWPNDERTWSNNVAMEPREVALSRELGAHGHPVHLMFIGCVYYTSSLTNELHQTPYVYHLCKTTSEGSTGFTLCEQCIEPQYMSLVAAAHWLRPPS